MIACVIPARGGSKRIPRKNIREFCGKPMIAWPIRAALETRVFDRVIVSTDDSEIADTARAYGAEAPFTRSSELSNDTTGTNPVVADACERIGANGTDDLICCLYATAPLIQSSDLLAGRTMFECAAGADFSFAATTYAFPVQRSLTIDEQGLVRPLFPEHIDSRSQDLPEVIHDAGAFYWGRPAAFAEHPIVFLARAVPFLLPRHRVQDVDTPEDWDLAELLFRHQHESGTAQSS